MRLRSLVPCALATVLSLPSTSAFACAPFMYEDAVAEARVRGADGQWRPLHIEVSGPLMRLEYASTRSASGRVGIVFDVESEGALVFPAPGPFEAPRQTRIAVPMGLDGALAGPGLPRAAVGRYPAPRHTLTPARRAGSFSCRDALSPPSAQSPAMDRSVCVIDLGEKRHAGLPAYVVDRAGTRVFELMSVTYQPVPMERFHAPAGFQVASPTLKRRTSCSG